MFRNILIIIVGVVVGSVIIYFVEALGHLIYPPPENMDYNDVEAMKLLISTLPTGALLMVLLAYILGSTGGGLISILMTKSSNIRNSLAVGFVLMIFGIINIFLIPHPVWFMIISLLVYIPCSYIGGLLGLKIKRNKDD